MAAPGGQIDEDLLSGIMAEDSLIFNRDIIVTRRYPNCDTQNKRIELQYDGPNPDLRVSKQSPSL